MIALLALLVPLTASVHFDNHEQPGKLSVRMGEKTYSAEPLISGDASHALKETVKFGGGVVTARENSLFIRRGKEEELLYSAPSGIRVGTLGGGTETIPRSKGGIVVGDRLLWIFGNDLLETMGEPSTSVNLCELQLRSEHEKPVSRVIRLTGLGAHINPSAVVKGRRVAFVNAEGISLVDLDAFRETATAKGGEGCVGPTGTIYFEKNGAISVFSLEDGQLRMKGMIDFGYLVGAFQVGGEDVLWLQNGLFTPNTRANYRFPGPYNTGSPQPFYVVPEVGIGFIDKYAFPHETPGILLSPHYLTPMAMIARSY